MADIFNFTDTWNDAGTVWNAIKVNVTNTASHADSRPLQIEVGGTSVFSVATDGRVTLGGQTITADAPALNITQTWNNGAILFNGIKANFTDTASQANSLMLNLQVGGTTKFSVKKDGRALMNGGAVYGNSTFGGANANWRSDNGSNFRTTSYLSWNLDAGIERLAAASLKITDGSTGLGTLTTKMLEADRTTEDAALINFKATVDADATSAISSLTTSGAVTHHIQISINGTTAWIPVSTTDPS